MLKRSPVMLPIPGPSQIAHLEESVAAGSVILSDEEFRAFDEQVRREQIDPRTFKDDALRRKS